jgi:hypothetical protein
MTELRIECLVDHADAPDIGLSLRRGQVAWVPLDSLKRSACLRALQNIRAVSVVSAQRCVMRNPPPPSFRLSRKAAPQRSPAPAAPPNTDDLNARIEQAVAGAVEKLADRLVAALGQSRSVAGDSTPLNEEALSRTVANAVAQALAQGGVAPHRTARAGGPEEPVYIPSGIVPSEAATDLQVTAQATDAGDLAGAASALRKTRTRKTPAGTTE